MILFFSNWLVYLQKHVLLLSQAGTGKFLSKYHTPFIIKGNNNFALPLFLNYSSDSNSMCLEMPQSIKILGLTSSFLRFLHIVPHTFLIYIYVYLFSLPSYKEWSPSLGMHWESFPSSRKLMEFYLVNQSSAFPLNVSMNCQRI